VFTILSAVAEAERDRIRETIRDVKAGPAQAAAISRRHRPVRLACGRRRRPYQQRAIRRILELRREGRSLRAISLALSAEGVKLSHEGVKNVLATAGAKAA
jgi:putative DNA-invertase from lambdoid prophage Rac